MIKAAVLLGANEEQASKETVEVIQLMGKLAKLNKKHLDPDAGIQLHKVGDLKDVYPEVRN